MSPAWQDVAHAVVWKAFGGGECLEPLFAVAARPPPVEAASVAAQPQGALRVLVEAVYLLYQARFRLVELILQVPVGERPFRRASRVQVDDVCPLQAAHPQLPVAVDDGAYAAVYALGHLPGQGDGQPFLPQVVEEDAFVGAHPDGVVDGVVGQRADEVDGVAAAVVRCQ